MTDRDDDALAIWHAGVKAVQPRQLIAEALQLIDEEGQRFLQTEGQLISERDINRVVVVGAGKATAEMAVAVEHVLQPLADSGLDIIGLISIPEGSERELQYIESIAGRPAGVNEPTAAGVQAAKRMLELCQSSGATDLCLALISGGGSALLPLPIDGITLADKLQVTRHLSAAGATIEMLNTVRKHLSAIKGGKLAAACGARWLITMVISDVLGDPLDLIASGPTVIDSSSPQDALRILKQFDPQQQLPSRVYEVLSRPQHRSPAEQLAFDQQQEILVIGNNATAVDASGIEAETRGYRHVMHSARKSEGAAEDVGRQLAEMAIQMLAANSPDQPNCLITGGEPVVTLAPPSVRGRGGRNQQLVLAAMIRLLEEPANVLQRIKREIVLLSGGTDGEDGPTDAAGAILNREVWDRFERSCLDPSDYLRRNDAYTFFEQLGGLIITGPTGTNVCDLRVVCLTTCD